jgi:hypothetical protein
MVGILSRRGSGLGRSGAVWAVLLAVSVEGVLLAVSVGRALSPSAYVVGLLKSDFLAYFC